MATVTSRVPPVLATRSRNASLVCSVASQAAQGMAETAWPSIEPCIPATTGGERNRDDASRDEVERQEPLPEGRGPEEAVAARSVARFGAARAERVTRSYGWPIRVPPRANATPRGVAPESRTHGR